MLFFGSGLNFLATFIFTPFLLSAIKTMLPQRGQWFEAGLVVAVIYAAAAAVVADTKVTGGDVRGGKYPSVLELTPSKVRRVEAKVKKESNHESNNDVAYFDILLLSQVPVWYAWSRNHRPTPRVLRAPPYRVMNLLWPKSWNLFRKRLDPSTRTRTKSTRTKNAGNRQYVPWIGKRNDVRLRGCAPHV